MSGKSVHPNGNTKPISGTIGENLNDSFQFENSCGVSTIGVYVTVPTGGTVAFEGTFDGVTWDAMSLRSIENDDFVRSTSTSGMFIGSIAATKFFRFRTSSAGSAPGSITGMGAQAPAILEGIEFGYPPHRIGYTVIHKDGSYTAAQTATALWTPASGKTFVVTDFIITASGNTDGQVKIFDGTDASGNYLFKGTFATSTQGTVVVPMSLTAPFVSAAADNVLKITTNADIDVDVMLSGYEI